MREQPTVVATLFPLADETRIPDWLVEKYEGLVITTASQTDPYCREDFQDICQRFRIKVWKALAYYDLSKVKNEQPDAKGRTALDRFVYTCVKNEQKDLFKQVKRDMEYMDEETLEAFLVAAETDALPAQRDMPMLPSTLSPTERQVVTMLYLDFDYGEIARLLNWRRQRVSIFVCRIREKMADWRPTSTDSPDAVPSAQQPVAA